MIFAPIERKYANSALPRIGLDDSFVGAPETRVPVWTIQATTEARSQRRDLRLAKITHRVVGGRCIIRPVSLAARAPQIIHPRPAWLGVGAAAYPRHAGGVRDRLDAPRRGIVRMAIGRRRRIVRMAIGRRRRIVRMAIGRRRLIKIDPVYHQCHDGEYQ